MCEDGRSATLDAGNVKLTYNALLEKVSGCRKLKLSFKGCIFRQRQEKKNDSRRRQESQENLKLPSRHYSVKGISPANRLGMISGLLLSLTLHLSLWLWSQSVSEFSRFWMAHLVLIFVLIFYHQEFQHEAEEMCSHHHSRTKKSKKNKKQRRKSRSRSVCFKIFLSRWNNHYILYIAFRFRRRSNSEEKARWQPLGIREWACEIKKAKEEKEEEQECLCNLIFVMWTLKAKVYLISLVPWPVRRRQRGPARISKQPCWKHQRWRRRPQRGGTGEKTYAAFATACTGESVAWQPC